VRFGVGRAGADQDVQQGDLPSADRIAEGDLRDPALQDRVDAGGAHREALGDLPPGRLPAQVLRQAGPRAQDGAHLTALLLGDEHGSGLARQGPQDGPPDPEDGAGGETRAAGRVEAARRLEETEVSLAQQIFERQSVVPIGQRNLDDEPQVRLHQIVIRRLVPCPDPKRQGPLVLLQETGVALESGQIARAAPGISVETLDHPCPPFTARPAPRRVGAMLPGARDASVPGR